MATDALSPTFNPLGGAPATSDDAVFELLSAAVFQARFRPRIVEQRWPSLRRAFADFRLAEVAAWGDDKVPQLLASPGMIRNPKKVLATLRNARDLSERARRHGGALAYLRDCGEGLVPEVDSWAHYVGAPSVAWFARNLRLRAGTG